MREEMMHEKDTYLPMPPTPREDEAIYGQLREYLLRQVVLSAPGELEIGEDSDLAFVVTAFARPKNPAPFSGLTPRMSKALALHSFVIQVCPALELTDEGRTRSESVMRTGVHAVAAQVLVQIMTRSILTKVVDGARSLVMAREAHLDD